MQQDGKWRGTKFPIERNNEQVPKAQASITVFLGARVCVCPPQVHLCLDSLSASLSFHMSLFLLTNYPHRSARECRLVVLLLAMRRGWPKLPIHILNNISMQPKQRRIDYKGCQRVWINSQCEGAVTLRREDWQPLIALLCINHTFIFRHKLCRRAQGRQLSQAQTNR